VSRSFGCDHCGATMQASDINRRPKGWSTIRINQALSESGRRRSVATIEGQHELCRDCTTELRSFLAKGATIQ